MTDISDQEALTSFAEERQSEEERNRLWRRLSRRTGFLQRAGLTESEALKQAGDELAERDQLTAVLKERKNRLILLRRKAILNRASGYKGGEGAFLERLLLGEEQKPGSSSTEALKEGSEKTAPPEPLHPDRSASHFPRSVFSGALLAEADIMGPLLRDLEKAGVLGALKRRDRDFDQDVARELWRLEASEPKSGPGSDSVKITAVEGPKPAKKNDPARKAAELLHFYQETLRKQQNKAGAWIARSEHYMTRHSHDAEKIRGNGTEEDYRAWRETILPKLDEKTLDFMEDSGDQEAFLRALWAALSAGRHESANGADWLAPDEMTIKGGTIGAGGSRNTPDTFLLVPPFQSRALIFRTADDWLDYNALYGRGHVVDSAMLGLRHGARNAAIMRVLGPDPVAMVTDLAEHLGKSYRAEAYQAGDIETRHEPLQGASAPRASGPGESDHDNLSREASVQSGSSDHEALMRVRDGNLLQIVTGQLIHPASQTLAQISSVMTLSQQVSDFGGIIVASLPDIAVGASVLRQDGMPLLKAYQKELFSLAPSLNEEKSPDNISHRGDVARFLEVGIRGVLGAVIRRFAAADSPLGVMSSLVSYFHDWSGHDWGEISYWRDSLFEGTGLMLSHYLGCQAGKDFASLPPSLQQSLIRYGIEAPEWEALRSVVVRADDGEPYLLAGELYRLKESTLSLLWEPDWTAEKHAGPWEPGQSDILSDPLTDTLWKNATEDEISPQTTQQREEARGGLTESEAVSRMAEDVRRSLREKLASYISDQVREALTGPDMIMTDDNTTDEGINGTYTTSERINKENTTKEGTNEDNTTIEGIPDANLTDATTIGGNTSPFLPGVKPGSDPLTSALEEAMQVVRAFRNFPLSIAKQDLAFGSERGRSDEAGMIHLMVAMLLLGYLALSARALAKGQKPHNPADWRTVMMAMVQGGSAGLYGDFLASEQRKGEQSRRDAHVLENSAPTLSDIASLYHHDGKKQNQPGRYETAPSREKTLRTSLITLIREAQGRVPGETLFYTNMALRYLLAHRLQEVVNPGYLKRYESQCENHQGQECWLSPSRNVKPSSPGANALNVLSS